MQRVRRAGSLSLLRYFSPPLRGAAGGRALTILQMTCFEPDSPVFQVAIL